MSNINDFMVKDGYLWKYNGNDTNIEIPDGVTSIASDTFADCDDITRLIIPDSVSSLGFNTFKRFNIEYLSIGSGLSSTNNDFNKESLKELAFSENKEQIGFFEFEGYINLVKITIPKSLTSIGDNAFSGCSGLESIIVEPENPVYHSAGNCLIETESKTLVVGCNNSVIPDDGSVTSISASAFSGCSLLEKIVIPKSIAIIDQSAFAGCTGLKEIYISSNTTEIGYEAFDGCKATIIYNIGNEFSKMASGAFEGFEGDISIIVEEGVTKIGDSAFWGCSLIKEIKIPNSVTSIGRSAFSGCSSLKSIFIPKSIISITGNIFSECSGLDSIVVETGNPIYHSSGNCLIETDSKVLLCGSNTSVIPDDGSVTSIYYGAFSERINLESIIVPDSITDLGEGSTFSNCSNLKKITLSKNITEIGDYTFANCEKLVEITIPDSVTNIGYGVFDGCRSLAKISIGSGLQRINLSGTVFQGCESISCIEVSDRNEHFYALNNCLIFADEKALLAVSSEGIIPEDENVTKIGKYAFSGLKLNSIKIPDNITEIDEAAFSDCSELISIEIPDSVTKIGEYAFSECESLEKVTIPNSVKEIGSSIFMNSNYKATIICEDKSFAQKYAKKNKIKFEIV